MAVQTARAGLSVILLISIAASASACGKGGFGGGCDSVGVVARQQVVKSCQDVCRDDCQQAVDTKCNTIPYQEQVCQDRPFQTTTQQCNKQCTTTTVTTTTTPTTTSGTVIVSGGCGGCSGCMSGCGSVGKGVSYGRRLFAVAADVGRRLQGLGFLPDFGKKGVVSKQVVVQQPVVMQSAVVSQPVIVHSQPAIVASQPQTICNDVCNDVPIVQYRKECQVITKTRQECTDMVTNICKKVCTPQCNEYVQNVPTAVVQTIQTAPMVQTVGKQHGVMVKGSVGIMKGHK